MVGIPPLYDTISPHHQKQMIMQQPEKAQSLTAMLNFIIVKPVASFLSLCSVNFNYFLNKYLASVNAVLFRAC